MAASDWTMQFLADMLDAPVDRPTVTETTALGAGYLAGWQAGLYPDPARFAETWRLERRFTPVDGGRDARAPLSRLARRGGADPARPRRLKPPTLVTTSSAMLQSRELP